MVEEEAAAQNILIYTQIITAVLLLISEILARCDCKANSVHELLLGECAGFQWTLNRKPINNPPKIFNLNENSIRPPIHENRSIGTQTD